MPFFYKIIFAAIKRKKIFFFCTLKKIISEMYLRKKEEIKEEKVIER